MIGCRKGSKQMTDEPQTYWAYKITVDGTCRLCAGESTLSDTLSDAFASATYYLWRYPDANVTISDIQEICSNCDNTGEVRAARSKVAYRMKRCPACKGKGAAGQLADIPVRLSDGNGGKGFRIVEKTDPAISSQEGLYD